MDYQEGNWGKELCRNGISERICQWIFWLQIQKKQWVCNGKKRYGVMSYTAQTKNCPAPIYILLKPPRNSFPGAYRGVVLVAISASQKLSVDISAFNNSLQIILFIYEAPHFFTNAMFLRPKLSNICPKLLAQRNLRCYVYSVP